LRLGEESEAVVAHYGVKTLCFERELLGKGNLTSRPLLFRAEEDDSA